MNFFRIIILLIITTFSSCNQQKTDFNFEKTVMNEIFPTLIDSLYYEPDQIPPPPIPYPEIYFSTSNQKTKDSIVKKYALEYDKIISEFENRQGKLRKDTSKKVIAVSDTIYELEDSDRKEFTKHFKNVEYELNNDILYKIDLSKFALNRKYSFKYISEFPKGSKIWKEKYDFHLSAVVSFSKIQFDKSKTFGILTGGISYGRLSGYGVIIFIRKESDKWVIDKMKETWIS